MLPKLAVISTLALCLSTFSAAAQQTQRVHGIVAALGDGKLTVKTEDGESVPVMLKPHYALVGIVKASVSDIKQGTFIGVGGRPQADGTIKAIQVFVFPESMRGRGEGHRPWGVLPETTMTNATVESMVTSANGPDIRLKYPGGEKETVIPADANVITAVAVDKSALTTGAEVAMVAEKQSDGSLQADRVSVAMKGAKLPL